MAGRATGEVVRNRTYRDTDAEIRATAREFLVTQGSSAITLRAIARELGITAPALYRYYASREDLIRHVCMDVCADLAASLRDGVTRRSEAGAAEQMLGVCRDFRSWAHAHPREFSLVFATPPGERGEDDTRGSEIMEPFGRVFLSVAGRTLLAHRAPGWDEGRVPESMRDGLTAFRDSFIAGLAADGIELPAGMLGLGTMYFMLEFWSRLYGHVALEVFDRFPVDVPDTDPLFESMLAGLATELGPPADGPA